MEAVEPVARHKVKNRLHRLLAEEVAAFVEVETAPAVTRRVLDLDARNLCAVLSSFGHLLQRLDGVEASGAPSMKNSIADHQIEELTSVSTIADGIAVKKPGTLTYELCEKYVDEIVTVTDDEISAAILALMEKQKLVTEGAGAVAVAAAMFKKIDLKGKKVVCVLSGGNIDVTILSRVIKRGLLMSGRSCQLTVELVDKPGQLEKVASLIAAAGGNVTSVHHERANEGSDVNGCYLRITLETRNFEHIQKIKQALLDAGLKLV